MFNHCFTTLALTLLCGLLNNSTAQAQSKNNKEGTSTVSGRVTIKGEPAPGITVILQPQQMMESGNTGTIPSAKTDGNGIFRITGVLAGRYFLNPFAPGFITPGELYFNTMPQGSVFQIGDGEDIEKIEIELIRGSVITGQSTTGDFDGRLKPGREKPMMICTAICHRRKPSRSDFLQ
jgi:hypothetical protein